MKYYSDKLNRLYDSEEELHKAEKEVEDQESKKAALSKEKKERAEEIRKAFQKSQDVRSQAIKDIKKADSEYSQLVQAFIRDYGSYHMSYYSSNNNPRVYISTSDLLENLLDKLGF